jgi:NADH-quinone oxidoreductase subunit G
VLPDLLPGYRSAQDAGFGPGLAYDEILNAPDLDVLWAVGSNPLARRSLAARNAFVVVQELFLTETAQIADVVLPAASAYEKEGTVTNVCGEVQRLKRAAKVMGPKPDLEIIGLIAREMKQNIGMWKAETVFQEIRATVHGYDVPLMIIESGGAAATDPVDGTIQFASNPNLIQSAHNNLFHSGTLGRYCEILSSVVEWPGSLYGTPLSESAEPVAAER